MDREGRTQSRLFYQATRFACTMGKWRRPEAKSTWIPILAPGWPFTRVTGLAQTEDRGDGGGQALSQCGGQQVSRLPTGMVADAGQRQVRDRDAETMTEIPSGYADVQIVDGGPQVELRSGRVAAEAAVTMTAEVDGEDPALRTAVAMDRTRATQARTTAGRGHEAQQVQHLPDSDLAANLPQINSRHGSPGSTEITRVGFSPE